MLTRTGSEQAPVLDPLALQLPNRKQLGFPQKTELVQTRAAGHLFVVAGAFDNDTERAVALAREIDWVGVDAILAIVPYYSKPNQTGIIEHFRRIADTVDSPVILSNVPGRVATGLEADTVALLSELLGVSDGDYVTISALNPKREYKTIRRRALSPKVRKRHLGRYINARVVAAAAEKLGAERIMELVSVGNVVSRRMVESSGLCLDTSLRTGIAVTQGGRFTK